MSTTETTAPTQTSPARAACEAFWAAVGAGPAGQDPAAAVIYQKHLAITDHRAPAYKPGKVGKRLPLHQACGHRHSPGSCPFQDGGAPGPDTARRGAARAREALNLTRQDDAEATP
jgi:hypothetical protein